MVILVTGGCGFIGSSVVKYIIKSGNTAINLDSLTYAGNYENLSTLDQNENYYFEKCDILEKKIVDKIIEKYKPNAIIHLAAESHVDRSINDSSKFIETNFVGTYNLLESSLKYWNYTGSPEGFRFLHVSTDEVFGSLSFDSKFKFSEDSPYSPTNPYSASKAGSDHLVQAWNKTFGLPTLITNCSNNFGPNQHYEKFIPKVITNSLLGREIPIYGNGKNVRDWIFVEDHVEALFMVLKRGKVGDRYNIGGNNIFSNYDLVNLICSKINEMYPKKNFNYLDLIKFVEDRQGHDQRYAIDSSRLIQNIGWKPKFNFDEALIETIEFYAQKII